MNETITNTTNNNIGFAVAPPDVSPRVVELMRRIDRLPAGSFEITITKPEVRAAEWQIEIVRTEPIMRFALSKYQPE